MKIRIKTPATSANLGPGFDFLGVALKLYNIYEFEESTEFMEVGFMNVGENLVLSTYKRVFEDFNIDLVLSSKFVNSFSK